MDKRVPFYSNGHFTPTRGKEYWTEEGELDFRTPLPIYTSDHAKAKNEKRDGSYRTAFGPTVHHNGKIYGDCDHNMSLALRRMTALRKPPEWYQPEVGNSVEDQRLRYESYEYYMTANQKKFLEENAPYFKALALAYAPHFDGYLGAEIECLEHYDDPHKKKALRIQGKDELFGQYQKHTVFGTSWCDTILYKMKKDEIAKLDKYPRAIGDLGVHASLLGFRSTYYLKLAQSRETFVENGITIEFIKAPTPDDLIHVFNNLLDPPGRGYFAYFSDDSCFSVRVDGKVYIFNVDISSCDASHTEAIFKTYQSLYPPGMQADISGLLDQCRQPINIVSRYDSSISITLQSNRIKLWSGSTMTTGINNVANLAIACALSKAVFSGSRIDVSEQIQRAAITAGYAVTCDICKNYWEIQFLKHSPVYDTLGRLQPMLNLGVMLRASGMCRGDLPGKKGVSIGDRAKAFQSALLKGLYPYINFPLLACMKAQCKTSYTNSASEQIVKDLLQYKVVGDTETFSISGAEMCKRYQLDDHEYTELLEDFNRPMVGLCIANSACSKILKMDYGLTAG